MAKGASWRLQVKFDEVGGIIVGSAATQPTSGTNGYNYAIYVTRELEPFLTRVAYEFSLLDGPLTASKKRTAKVEKKLAGVEKKLAHGDEKFDRFKKWVEDKGIDCSDFESGDDADIDSDNDDDDINDDDTSGTNGDDTDTHDNDDDDGGGDETGATEGLATGATAWVTDGDILVVRQHHGTLRSGRAHYAHSDSDHEMDYYAAEQQVVRLLLLQFANDASGHRRSNLLGQILDEGASGCYICNKNRNHWVALFFDGVSREVLYFDPLGNEIDDKLCAAIIKATDAAVQTWTHNDWSSAKVQCDDYNCGIWCLLVEKCFVEWLSTSGTGGSFADSLRSSTSQLNSATATTIAELRTVRSTAGGGRGRSCRASPA
jgi:hypothetical protein